MKYYTQQWWRDSQKSHRILFLKVSDEAKEYSEQYFQRLYRELLDEYIAFWKRKLDWIDKNPEDLTAEIYSSRLNQLESDLPDEIKNAIADIRAAALGFVAHDIFEKIQTYCKKLEEQTIAVMNSYRDYYASIKDRIPKQIAEPLLSQHEARVRKIGFLNGDYIIHTKRQNVEYIFKFKNASVLQDIEKTGHLSWDYNEIYLRDNGYEIHILFIVSSQSDKRREIILTDAIIFAKAIDIEIIEKEPEEYYTEFI